MMTPEEKDLWLRVQQFPIDNPEYAFNFSDRLARENGWNKKFALAVIEEYRKFIFLCAITPTGVTPCYAVDQAWHLHLTYTKSYWTALCRDTLGKDLHHNPTQGGKKEAVKFHDYYEQTLAIYRDKFDAEPPAAIWLQSKERFSDIDYVNVNKRTHWIIPKPKRGLRKQLGIGLLALLCSLFIMASEQFVFLAGFGTTALIIVAATRYKSNGKKPQQSDGSSGCSTHIAGGCSSPDYVAGSDDHHGHDSHHGHSGCGSDSHNGGDSGCSSSGCSSGCSGCGGGGD